MDMYGCVDRVNAAVRNSSMSALPCMVIVNTSLDAQAAPVLYPTLPIL